MGAGAATTLFSCASVSVLMVVVCLPLVFAQPIDLCNGKYFCSDCSTTTSSNRGASFEDNLLRLRDSLHDMVAANAIFLSATFFAGGDAEDTDKVYGLALCFADAERADCAACLVGAAPELTSTRCASRRDMVLWYPQCLVRYDNASFFGAADTSPARRFDVPNPNNYSDPARLDAARARLAGRMLAAAAASTARFAFDFEEVTTGGNVTLHGLAQCTQDLPDEECSRCLASHVAWLNGCFADMKGVRLKGPNCYLALRVHGVHAWLAAVHGAAVRAVSTGACLGCREEKEQNLHISRGVECSSGTARLPSWRGVPLLQEAPPMAMEEDNQIKR